uniref:Mitochondrial intermediate peptidase n=1 Tax=Phallusia mammillata TaxID=59560 RepID=A0A6F9DLI4_9ASCI|nr:mitochondrial intermediate peptidase [Phallusia mammillata]
MKQFLKPKLLSHARQLAKNQRLSVATWNALAASFNNTPQRKFDFFSKNVGLFQVPELKSPDGFKKAKENAMQEGWKLLDRAVNVTPGEETVVLFDELSDTLCRVADLSDFIRCAHPDSEFSEAAADAHLGIGTMVEELNTHMDLYNCIKNVTENKNVMESLDVETQTVANLFMYDFKISGIHLDHEQRQKAVQLHEEILQLTSTFLQQSHSPVAFPKSDLPDEFHSRFKQVGDNLVISSLHSDSADEVIREASYRLYYYTNPETEATLCRLLEARNEVAQLVGFPTFSQRALKSTMAKNPQSVYKFLNTLSERLKPLVKKELDDLKSFKISETPLSTSFQPWDLHYYVNKLKEKKALIDPVLYSSFFSLGDCMNGLSALYSSLFGVTLTAVPVQKGETWNNDIIKLAVVHRTEGVLGHIYCDFFNRPGKPQQDCHFTIRGGRRLRDGSYQSPIVVLMLHLPSASFSQPPLLTPSTVNNLFHEMGHAMHSMLARTRYQHVTGTRCSTDFAEVPSVLMEYFAMDRRVLSSFAKHHKTRETLPLEMINKLCHADKLCATSEMQTQVFYALVDQHFHDDFKPGMTTNQVVDKVHADHYFMQAVPNTSWHLRFPHFASYGAKYYSYLMSRAVASRVWNKCFKDDPFNNEMGQRYRSEMLCHGGGKDPALMFESMLQEDFNLESLVDTLIIDSQS